MTRHIRSTGTTALSAVLGTRLRELFVATAGIPRQAVLHFDARLNPGPARDTAGSAGVGGQSSGLPEHLVADRSTLRRILISGIEDQVRFGARVTGYGRRADGRVCVHLAAGDSVTADVLVAADGVHSAIRAQLLPHAEAVDLGARHITAKIPLDESTRARIPRELFSTFTLIHGTTLSGIATLLEAIPGAPQAVLGSWCPACLDQATGSPFLTNLNAGGDTVPGVHYTVLSSIYDFVATPVQSQFLSGPDVHNILLQNDCFPDTALHTTIQIDPVAEHETSTPSTRRTRRTPAAACPRDPRRVV